MYRHDMKRSGSVNTILPVRPGKLWEAEVASEATPPVIVGDRVWVAEKDSHRISCLSAIDGTVLWRYTAGGRIDSAPTIYQGKVVFGCRDGSVYCLRATDGKLAWRFHAAPVDLQIVSYERIESSWPVHGSVLIANDVAYFAAGRSSYLDGGIMAYGLDVHTGNVVYNHHLDGPHPDIKAPDAGRPHSMEGALPDIFVSDGADLYMRRIKFDAELNRKIVKANTRNDEKDVGVNRLTATGGFLDTTGSDRMFWMYSNWWPGFTFAQYSPKAGQLVVFNDNTTYAVKYFYQRAFLSPAFTPGEKGYLLFADDNDNQPKFVDEDNGKKWLPWGPEKLTKIHENLLRGPGEDKRIGYVRGEGKPEKWHTMIPVRVRAMLLAKNHLIVAGPKDAIDPEDPHATFEGRTSSILQIVSPADGKILNEMQLKATPVFDGMAAASGKLFISMKNNTLICLGEK
jgi:hypothetical protein